MTFTDPVTAGLIVCSHSPNQLNTSTFDNVSLVSGTGSLPSPWTDSDVGSPAVAGSASYANGVFTVQGSGADVWNTTDQFNYVSQPESGNFTITARVTSQSNTDPWAKSGVIIKQSTTSGTAYAMLAVTPSNGVTFQYGYNSDISGGTYTFPNAWLRLTRSGSTITAYTSADGSTWTQVGSDDDDVHRPGDRRADRLLAQPEPAQHLHLRQRERLGDGCGGSLAPPHPRPSREGNARGFGAK